MELMTSRKFMMFGSLPPMIYKKAEKYVVIYYGLFQKRLYQMGGPEINFNWEGRAGSDTI